MTAGLNVSARIWRESQAPDDSSGGAIITGTVAYECVHARFSPQRPNMLLLQQGLETDKIAVAMVRPPSLVIYERDEFEIVGPPNHQFYGNHFRIISVESAGVHPSDGRGFLTLTLSRIVRTRTQQ